MIANANEICVKLPLSEQETWDLAQFPKQTGFADFRSHAVDDEEANRMLVVAEMIRRNLEVHGINPR